MQQQHPKIRLPEDMVMLESILLTAGQKKKICFRVVEIEGVEIPQVCFRYRIFGETTRLHVHVEITMFDHSILMYLDKKTLTLANYFPEGKTRQQRQHPMTTLQFAKVFHAVGRMFHVSTLEATNIDHHLMCTDDNDTYFAYSFIHGIPFYSKNFGFKMDPRDTTLEKKFLYRYAEALRRLSVEPCAYSPTTGGGSSRGSSRASIPLQDLITYWKSRLYQKRKSCAQIEACIQVMLRHALTDDLQKLDINIELLLEVDDTDHIEDLDDNRETMIHLWKDYQQEYERTKEEGVLWKIFCLQCLISGLVKNESIHTRDIIVFIHDHEDPTLAPFISIYSSPVHRSQLWQRILSKKLQQQSEHQRKHNKTVFSPSTTRGLHDARITKYVAKNRSKRQEEIARWRAQTQAFYQRIIHNASSSL